MRDCRGELLQRVRRGVATDQECLAFEAHLGFCSDCALLYELACDFDEEGAAQTGDLELVGRIAAYAEVTAPSAALRTGALLGPILETTDALRRPGPVRGKIQRRLGQLCAAAVLCCGAAAALSYSEGVWPLGRAKSKNSEGSRGESMVERAGPGRQATAPPVNSSSVPLDAKQLAGTNDPAGSNDPGQPKRPAANEGKDAGTDSSIPNPAGGRAQDAEVVKAPSPTAAQLFKLANDARRSGQHAAAIASYLKLHHTFPASKEAQISRVSLAGLYLQSGQAAAALRQFDTYLSSSSRRLAAEALFGKAQALRALGRSAEEEQTWKQLLARYPNSAYSSQARVRLGKGPNELSSPSR